MKPPPFLLFAGLLFWGWQTDFLFAGAVLGAVLESARWLRFRWDLDDADFNRLWSFCLILTLALAAWTLTNNERGLGALVRGPTTAPTADPMTTTRFLRWLPLTFFAFTAAQVFNVRPTVPLTAISLVLRWRRRKGEQIFAGRYFDICFPYFITCLFAASVRKNDGSLVYFSGLCLLMAWGLWVVRPQRFSWRALFFAWLLVMGLGVMAILGLNQAQRAITNFNAQWIAKFFSNRPDPLQSMTSMGRIGELKLSANIVIRLEPNEPGRVPSYLREASYRNFQPLKAMWFAGGALADFTLINGEADGQTWILQTGKKNDTLVNIACYLNGWSREYQSPEGLLPLPSGATRLSHASGILALKANRNGAVQVAGSGLQIFDVAYGAGHTLDAPPNLTGTNNYDLVVPTNEVPALEAVLAEMNLPPAADLMQTRAAIGRFFSEKFSYSTWQGREKRGTAVTTPLTKFLTISRSGHCEYFATATVLLLRQLGIPARYAVGYYVHETRGTGYVVRERDAHAWCLVWNEATQIWEDFDTTPPSWVALESQRTQFGQRWADFTSWCKFQFAKFRWQQASFQQYIVWALVPVLGVLLWHIIFRRRGRLRANVADSHAAGLVWPGLDSEFYQLTARLTEHGVPRQPGETLADWLERALAAPALAPWREPLWELLQLHYRLRFDPPGLTAGERETLRVRVQQLSQQLKTLPK